MTRELMVIISNFCMNVTYVNMYIVGLLQTLPKSASEKLDSMIRDIESDLLLSAKCLRARYIVKEHSHIFNK
jgi:hypothetical protein